jgi:hypothetical protein
VWWFERGYAAHEGFWVSTVTRAIYLLVMAVRRGKEGFGTRSLAQVRSAIFHSGRGHAFRLEIGD